MLKEVMTGQKFTFMLLLTALDRHHTAEPCMCMIDGCGMTRGAPGQRVYVGLRDCVCVPVMTSTNVRFSIAPHTSVLSPQNPKMRKTLYLLDGSHALALQTFGFCSSHVQLPRA